MHTFFSNARRPTEGTPSIKKLREMVFGKRTVRHQSRKAEGQEKAPESEKSDDGQPKAADDQDARAELRAIESGQKTKRKGHGRRAASECAVVLDAVSKVYGYEADAAGMNDALLIEKLLDLGRVSGGNVIFVFHRWRSRRSYARQKRTPRPERKYFLFSRGLSAGTLQSGTILEQIGQFRHSLCGLTITAVSSCVFRGAAAFGAP